MVTALNRKLLRELWRLRAQLLAVALITVCGVAVFVTMRGMVDSLVAARDGYYAQYRFADVFANVKRAPEWTATRLAALPGVAATDTGIALEVTLDVAGLSEPATGQLISVPDRGRLAISDLHVVAGRYLDPGSDTETLVSLAFARANALAPGAQLAAVINGRWRRLTIVGIAISPEFVFVMRPATLLPDDRRFGILWMRRSALAHAYDMDGAYNRVSLQLERGASAAEVIAGVDRVLSRYGTPGAFGRADHLSDKALADEIRQDRVYGGVVSAIFLSVAAFVIHIVLTRLVATQRAEIAVLKAFGYSNAALGWHYLKLAFAAVLCGAVLALPVAAWLGDGLTAIYRDFFHFPHLAWSAGAASIALAMAVSLAAAGVGAGLAVARAVRLPPAQAMRPEPPHEFRPTWVERAGLQRWLSPAARMVLRNVERRPVKALLSILGIALAVAILIAGRFGMDSLDHIIDIQFRLAQREDVQVDLNNPRAAGARASFAKLPGVTSAEPFRQVAVRLSSAHRERRTAILGLPPGAQLRAIVDVHKRRVRLPEHGLLLSAKMAQNLGLALGDSVGVEFLEGRRAVRRVVLTGLVDDPIGIGAYMSLPVLNGLLQEDPATITGAWLAVDPAAREDLYRKLKSLPGIRAVSVRESMLASFRDVIARSLLVQTIANIVFASVIAFGVVYNSVRIALSERGNELASLRVLGFTHREVAAMLLGEQLVLVLVAIPLGFAVGAGICAMLVMALDAQETMRLPLVFSGRTFAFAFVIVATAAMLSAFAIWRRLRGLDLIAVLKTRE